MRSQYSRRDILALGLGLGGASLLPSIASAQTGEDRALTLHNSHTGESLTTTYLINGNYNYAALGELNKLLRDHRQNASTEMDPVLFEQLWLIQRLLQDDSSIEIISGYRTAKTNRMLRAKSKGVAKNSYHPKGQAIDFRIPGVSTDQIRNVATHLQIGGVGYYRRSNFVHIDTGPHRSWS